MVTEAGKELLRNTINTAKFHNRILEENEMWKQWELECGLTMMVSDDDILKRIRKNHQCSKHRKRDKSKDSDKCRSESSVFSAGPSNTIERWDHSGFQELYPDGVLAEKSSSSTSSKSNSSKWDHSGFQELYPDKVPAEKSSSSTSSKSSSKHKKKKRKHHRKSSTSDSEILEEFKRYKRSKQKLKSKEKEGSSHTFDNHVKEWRKLNERS